MLSALSLCDTWQEVYGPILDPDDSRRRIDKVHVSTHMCSSLV